MNGIFRKTLGLLVVVTLSVTGFSSLAFAGGVVVVHPNNNAEISAADVKFLFLGKKKKFSGGYPATAINQTFGSAFRKKFDQEMLDKSGPQMKSYWAKLVFTGKGSPLMEVSSDEEVIKLILEDESVIGYIDESEVIDTVKVIFKF